jgi:hypothetical protein
MRTNERPPVGEIEMWRKAHSFLLGCIIVVNSSYRIFEFQINVDTFYLLLFELDGRRSPEYFAKR